MESPETETAYFALLRAREEIQQLRNYQEYLSVEARRLRRNQSESAALIDTVDRRYRRLFQANDQAVFEAVAERLTLIDDEHQRLPLRITAAEEFVNDCERQYHALKDLPDVS